MRNPILLNEPGIGALSERDLPASNNQARALAALSRTDKAQAGPRTGMSGTGLVVNHATAAALQRLGLADRQGESLSITGLGRLAVAWLSADDLVGPR